METFINKELSFKDIESLQIPFKIGCETIVEYFEVNKSDSFCIIKSCLKHADDNIKSPYFYYNCEIGVGSDKKCLDKFNNWLVGLKINKDGILHRSKQSLAY